MLPTPRHHTLYLLGWQERIALPELHIAELPVKVDTGAKTSALHAENFAEFERGGERLVRFEVALPWPPGAEPTAPLRRAEAPLLDYRQVTSSNGAGELRPVIRTPLELFGERWPIEVTLTGR